VSQPPTPVASFGPSYAGSNPHGPDENIRIDDFLESIKLIGRVIHRLGAARSKSASEVHEDSKSTAPLPKLSHKKAQES
jgi:hypothetical protein